MTQQRKTDPTDNYKIYVFFLNEMGRLRRKFKPFTQWHEAYAYIKNGVNEFSKLADEHKEISRAEIILCENCGSTYDDIYGKCPLCNFQKVDYNPIDPNKLASHLEKMKESLTKIAAFNLLASAECGNKPKGWHLIVSELGAVIHDLKLEPEPIENLPIKVVFKNGIQHHLDQLWAIIKTDERDRFQELKLNLECYRIAAYSYYIIIHIEDILNHLTVEQQNG